MSKLCENCTSNMIWNYYKKVWECKLCGYGEGDPFESNLNTPGYVN